MICRVRDENQWSTPWSRVRLATTATRIAGSDRDQREQGDDADVEPRRPPVPCRARATSRVDFPATIATEEARSEDAVDDQRPGARPRASARSGSDRVRMRKVALTAATERIADDGSRDAAPSRGPDRDGSGRGHELTGSPRAALLVNAVSDGRRDRRRGGSLLVPLRPIATALWRKCNGQPAQKL